MGFPWLSVLIAFGFPFLKTTKLFFFSSLHREISFVNSIWNTKAPSGPEGAGGGRSVGVAWELACPCPAASQHGPQPGAFSERCLRFPNPVDQPSLPPSSCLHSAQH